MRTRQEIEQRISELERSLRNLDADFVELAKDSEANREPVAMEIYVHRRLIETLRWVLTPPYADITSTYGDPVA